MKKIVKYSSLAALGLVAAGVLAACSGGDKKDTATSEAASAKKEIIVATNASPKPFSQLRKTPLEDQRRARILVL